jgi:hypothetical protein
MGWGRLFKIQQTAQASKDARARSALATRVKGTLRPIDSASTATPPKLGLVLPRSFR